ncbi:hypothetical protein ABZS76_33095 [Streptomyces sp. NPDC005562]|uniref:hypothetical protein n=1 Tax=Streptomyces sp. NPDC005562 TaxID=3154890 RepID=UPI0033B04DC0
MGAFKHLQHETLGVQRLAVRSEEYWEFQPDQPVQTTDGFPGIVTAVLDGPYPGHEEYLVTLDHGLGGGSYAASQLRPVAVTTAAMEQTAAADYPELAQILVERPDPAGVAVYAAKKDDKPNENDADADDDHDDDADADDDHDDEDDEDTPPWAKEASAVFASLIVTAAADRDFRFHVTAAWRDVVAKAKRLRAEGRLRVTLASDGYVFAEIKGDHQVYETGLQRLPGRTAAHSWSCGCKWGAYHWGADDDFSRFAGRMCSHALALQYEAQSRGMFGRDVHVDEQKPTWVPRHVVVRYDIDADKHRLVRSSARKLANDEWNRRPEEGRTYVRFGDWPHDERSENMVMGHKEDGVSVYDMDHHGDPMDPDPHYSRYHEHDEHCEPDCDLHEMNEYYGNDTKQEMDGRVHRAERGRLNGFDRAQERGHVVKGDMVGIGHDGEPLLRDVRRVGDWIDHKHLFAAPGAEPHRLARHPDDEEYEKPKGLPRRPRTASAAAPLSVVARAAVTAGEDAQEVLLALAAAGIKAGPGQEELFTRHDFAKAVKHEASVDAPFGEPSGTSHQLPKAPGATSPRFPWENPASAGPLAGADPVGWNRKLPLESFAALDDAALFEPSGAEAELHDEPEGALPATDGVQIPSEDEALTPSMAGLKRQALKDFTLAERRALIEEGESVRAANLDRLIIDGTHYADLEQILAAQEDDTTWLA